MNPSDVAIVIAYATGLDIRMQCDEQTMRNRVVAWHSILGEVPIEVARDVVRRHYARADAQPITPAVILARWEAQPENRDRPELPALGQPMPAPVGAALSGVLGAARQRGEDSRRTVDAVACPWPPCRAVVGRRCAMWDGRRHVTLNHPHPSRVDLAAALR